MRLLKGGVCSLSVPLLIEGGAASYQRVGASSQMTGPFEGLGCVTSPAA